MGVKQTCSVEGCHRTDLLARGWCSPHYQKWLKYGDPTYVRPVKRGVLPCLVEDCDGTYHTGGYCGRHYKKWLIYGDPKGGQHEWATSNHEYLNARHEKAPSGCWLWNHIGQHGYGKATPVRVKRGDRNGKTVIAHRMAYETWVGPIPKGAVIHHKCHTRACINPDHLQAITQTENAAEMFERQAYLKEIRELKRRIQDLEEDAA